METISNARDQIRSLSSSIQQFITTSAEAATYRAPIIDWHHPDTYRQSGIIGLKKFLQTVENERDHIDSLAGSSLPPKEVATNLPHLLAVWEQVDKAQWPIVCIAQVLECGDAGQVKVDVVAKGGQEWIKVNTMKESRLMAEFREQDSYANSDYDTDTGSESDRAPGSSSSTRFEAGPSSRKRLTNSAIEQASVLVRAANAYPRIPGFPPPKVKYVLNRLEENPEGGYADPRVQETFEAIRALGAELVLASDDQPTHRRLETPPLRPTKEILLDLSVVVALCCDSTHQPLPSSPQELEERFRALRVNSQGEAELTPHIPVTKDLRDQLEWEMKHPLILEMQERLAPLISDGGEGIEFWVTDEVKSRLPAIADIIGGDDEKARAKAMFDGGDFWAGSRWKGKQGILGEMVVRVLPPDIDGSAQNTRLASTDDEEYLASPFRKGFVTICRTMLDIVKAQSSSSSLPTQPGPERPKNHRKHKKGTRKSRQPPIGISLASRLPSAHTLRTLIVGFERGWTVLTNNRGAVGKVVREMRIGEGLGYGHPPIEGDKGEVAIWVVNPSSLAEWRRKEVESRNEQVRAYLADPKKEESYRIWLEEGADVLEKLGLGEKET